MKILNFRKRGVGKGPAFATPVVSEDPEPSGYYYFFSEKHIYVRIRKSYEGTRFEITNKMSGRERTAFFLAKAQEKKEQEMNSLDWN